MCIHRTANNIDSVNCVMVQKLKALPKRLIYSIHNCPGVICTTDSACMHGYLKVNLDSYRNTKISYFY